MKMTESPILSKVLDDTVYVGIPLTSQESTISDSSPSLLVPKSKNSTTVSPSESFESYIRYGGLITFVSGAVIGAIGSVIDLGFEIVSVLLSGRFGYFSSMLHLCASLLFIFVLRTFFKSWHPSALRDSLVAVTSKTIGQLGLGFGSLGMQVLLSIMYQLSAGYIICVALVWVAFLLLLSLQLLYCNGRTMEGANNSQHSGNVKNTDSLLYAQIETV